MQNFIVPDFRTGDVIEMKWKQSISEYNVNTYRGLVLSVVKRNTIDAAFKIMFRFCGTDCLMFVKLNSPFL